MLLVLMISLRMIHFVSMYLKDLLTFIKFMSLQNWSFLYFQPLLIRNRLIFTEKLHGTVSVQNDHKYLKKLSLFLGAIQTICAICLIHYCPALPFGKSKGVDKNYLLFSNFCPLRLVTRSIHSWEVGYSHIYIQSF